MDGFVGGVSIPLSEYSEVQMERMEYVPSLPPALLEPSKTGVAIGESTVARASSEEAVLRSWFPALYGQPIVELRGDGSTSSRSNPTGTLRVGVVFCGRQTPGAHNVVCGLFDHLTALSAGNEILGFDGGTKGFFDGKARRLTADTLAPFRNQGGMHMLGRSVDRIRSGSEQAAALATAEALKLDGLVLVGGTFTNTDAAHLAEYFAERQAGGALQTRVVGVPVTIDGDIRNEFVEVSLGHDTATKLYSQLTGNMATDSNSAKKYWYWCRLMGRTTGHVALEVALQTHPNAILLAEDIEARRMTLSDIVRDLADVVAARAAAGKNFGVVLVPEGTIAAIPELRTLIAELDHLSREGVEAAAVPSRLTPWSAAVLAYLPPLIRSQLFLERESSGAIQLSQISTEQLLSELVGNELGRRAKAGSYKGKYAAVQTSFGYQARSAFPSNFDCSYGAALGRTAAALVVGGFTGYMATVRRLAAPPAEWEPAGVPLTAMMSVPLPGTVHEVAYSTASSAAGAGTSGAAAASAVPPAHKGARPVIESAPVDVHGPAFAELRRQAADWRVHDRYANPGPTQFEGVGADDTTLTLRLARHDYMARIAQLRGALDTVRDICKPGVPEAILDAAVTGMTSLAHILSVMRERE